MSLMNWTVEYSVGVDEIDEQHKKMFSIINNLYDAMHTEAADESLEKCIQDMIAYADYHFSTEEKYFEEFNYPGKDEHVKAHDAYRGKVLSYAKEFEEHKKVLSFDVLDFLEDWWLGHVTKVDKQYTDFFNEHGLR